MAGDASWWENPEAQGSDTPVIRHAPDSHNYHLPDQDQLAKMRGSKVGRFAIIPAANKDGTSKAFDPTVAGPVHVDPDAPDGGVIFDPDTVRKQDVNRVVAQSYYPHQAFYALGTPAPLLGLGTKKQAAFASQQQEHGFGVDRGPNPHMPNTYVTPSASAQSGRLSEMPAYVNQTRPAQEEYPVNNNGVPPLASLPPINMAGPTPMQAPAPAAPQQPQYAPPPQPQYAPPAPPGYYQPPQAYQPPPMDPNLSAMMHAMVGLQQQVAALAARPTALPPTTGVSQVPMPVSRPLTTQPVELQRQRNAAPQQGGEYDDETARPIRRVVKRNKQQDIDEQEAEVHGNQGGEEADEPQQTMRAYNERQAPPQEAVIAGFETLNLKFVTGPLPHKAKKQVVFEIPGAGKNLAKFHDVIDSVNCVVLVYDTRYEDGFQYVPPELGDGTVITMHVKTGKDKTQAFKVASMGLQYSFGVFDHIVMVKVGGEGVDYGGEDDE